MKNLPLDNIIISLIVGIMLLVIVNFFNFDLITTVFAIFSALLVKIYTNQDRIEALEENFEI